MKTVTFTKPHTYRNRDFLPGETCEDVPDRDAGVLVAIGRAQENPATEAEAKPRRGYRRRDMTAESLRSDS